ncbi:hypothetical protein JVX98_23370 [Ensifer sp. PDNC004]|uniref:hypothetical protein n=1 Tax=Ensifer sp. PDNC004 TaxID=2811423 RepID=UPI0019667EFC|nr:hypothetical protein [Ensifer sp. PDNC004]QRY67288.1 hypothetical protein JVX98_23370 [Ensifer sp. PDNC004]
MEDVLGRLAEAIDRVLDNDRLARFQPSEVAVTFELGWHLRELFGNEWDVNGEYDRLGEDEKALQYPGRPPRKPTNRIRPDIIVHIMGERNNLLVVEAKLHGNNNYAYDDWKLRGMTWQEGEYGYFVGVHLVFFIAARRLASCTVYTNGEVDEAWTGWLQEKYLED